MSDRSSNEPQTTGAVPRRGSTEVEWVTVSATQRRQSHWWLFLVYGVVAILLGCVLASSPSRTITLVALLAAFVLVVHGSSQVFVAIVPSQMRTRERVGNGILGLVAIAVGVVCFIAPLQTLTFTGFVLGAWLLLAGLGEVALSLVSERVEHRIWVVVRGMLAVVVGTVLLVSPKSSLGLVVIALCTWLIGSGALSVLAAVVLRRRAVT